MNGYIFQKTLPVMVAVVEPLGGSFGETGLLVLPCVAAHLLQVQTTYMLPLAFSLISDLHFYLIDRLSWTPSS